jgi:hypothetical protein
LRPELFLLGVLVWVLEALRLLAGWRARETDRGSTESAAPSASAAGLLLLLQAAAFAAVLLPYTLFCLHTAGRPLPNTYYVKSFLPSIDSQAWLATRRAAYFRLLWYYLRDDNALIALLLPLGFIVWWVRSRRRICWVVPLWPLVFWVQALIANPWHYSMSRYTMPLVPCFALLGMRVLEAVWARFPAARHRHIVVAASAVVLCVAAVKGEVTYHGRYQENVDNILKMQVKMGEWVAANVPPGARVATNDVGAITYYGGRYCIDTVGLISSGLITETLKRYREKGVKDEEATLVLYLRQTPPDYCIIFPDWYPRIAKAPWLSKVYEIDYPNSTGGGDELVAYKVIARPGLPQGMKE